jgi:hypothetical protein
MPSHVTDHQFYAVGCPRCPRVVRVTRPATVGDTTFFGPRLTACIGLLHDHQEESP